MHGRGPASSYRPRRGRRVGAVLRPAYRSRAVDCPADLIPGVLTLYPNMGTGIEPVRGRRPRVQGPRPDGLEPQMPVYSWHLPTPACARTAVPEDTVDKILTVCERASSPPCRSLRSRLRKGNPRYRLLKRPCRPLQTASTEKRLAVVRLADGGRRQTESPDREGKRSHQTETANGVAGHTMTAPQSSPASAAATRRQSGGSPQSPSRSRSRRGREPWSAPPARGRRVSNARGSRGIVGPAPRGRRLGPPVPRQSCMPDGSPRRRTPAGQPARRLRG